MITTYDFDGIAGRWRFRIRDPKNDMIEYDSKYVPKLQAYCRRNLSDIANQGFGHWHYAHYYYSQVLYREGGTQWETYRDKVYARLASEATETGNYVYWNQGYIGPIYTTAINLTIMQLENGALPIYQR